MPAGTIGVNRASKPRSSESGKDQAMPALAQGPTVVAGSSPLGEHIRSCVAETSAGPVGRCTFDDCRQHVAWNRPGLVFLVAADDGDWEPLAGVAREATLR